MSETMGKIIRRLRKERGITQEELAEALCVTSQAVSKWENCTSLPDISQLVPMANLFEVSIDTLFSRENITVDEQVEAFINEIEERYPEFRCDYEKFIDLTEGLKKFPNHPKLLEKIVSKAYLLVSQTYSERNSFIFTTAIRAADLYIENSPTIGNRIWMTAKKIDLCAIAGRFAEAEELAKEFVIPLVSSSMYLARIARQRKDYPAEIHHRQESIAQLFSYLADEIAELAVAYRENGQIEDALEANMVNLRLPYTIHGDGKFHAPLHNFHYISGFEAAYDLMLLGRHDEALDLLEKIFDYGEEQCKFCTNSEPITSPLLRDIDMTPFHSELHPSDYLWKINYPDFEPLYKYARFQALLERYNAYLK